jgi:hypothetical protein
LHFGNILAAGRCNFAPTCYISIALVVQLIAKNPDLKRLSFGFFYALRFAALSDSQASTSASKKPMVRGDSLICLGNSPRDNNAYIVERLNPVFWMVCGKRMTWFDCFTCNILLKIIALSCGGI